MNGKLKILFLCPQPLWPTNTGARLRNFHLANVLGSHCEVTVLQALDPAGSKPPQTHSSIQTVLSANREKGYTPAKIIRGLIGPLPLTVLNYQSPQMEHCLIEALNTNSFDIVQIESIHLAPYLPVIRRRVRRVVLDWHNVESELMRRFGQGTPNPAKKWVAARTSRLLHQLEDQALHSFTAHTVVSDLERDKLLVRVPDATVHVIPNGVDTAAFANNSPLKPGERHTLLFVGSMDYHANSDAVIWFCREIWPQLGAEFSNLDFKIVGRNPPPSVQTLASQRTIVTGTVDDVRPHYHQAFAVVVPLRVGGGTRLKILEAMAAGVPVISTRLGAEGILAKDQESILLADTASDMAHAIRSLLTEPGLASRMVDAARQLVLTAYDWAVVGGKLAGIYQALKS